MLKSSQFSVTQNEEEAPDYLYKDSQRLAETFEKKKMSPLIEKKK